MKQFEARFKQVDVLPMVKYYMDELDLFNLFKKYVPAPPDCLADKDFRPDCKQIVFGLNITSDGHVPLSYKLFDGNTNDDVTHIPNWNGLRTLLEKEDFIYVADCKLCSQKNLTHIARNGGLFITIVPKGRKEVKQFLKDLKSNDIKWKDAYKIESSRKKGNEYGKRR